MLTPQAASPHRPKPGGFLHGLVATTPGKRVVVKPKDGKLVPARVLDRPWVQKNGFGKISDPVIHAMCWYLTAPEISALAATCRRLQAQTQHEPVWKAILEKAYPSLAGKDRNMPDSMRLRYLGERRRLKVKDNDATKVEWDSWRYEGRALVFRLLDEIVVWPCFGCFFLIGLITMVVELNESNSLTMGSMTPFIILALFAILMSVMYCLRFMQRNFKEKDPELTSNNDSIILALTRAAIVGKNDRVQLPIPCLQFILLTVWLLLMLLRGTGSISTSWPEVFIPCWFLLATFCFYPMWPAFSRCSGREIRQFYFFSWLCVIIPLFVFLLLAMYKLHHGLLDPSATPTVAVAFIPIFIQNVCLCWLGFLCAKKTDGLSVILTIGCLLPLLAFEIMLSVFLNDGPSGTLNWGKVFAPIFLIASVCAVSSVVLAIKVWKRDRHGQSAWRQHEYSRPHKALNV